MRISRDQRPAGASGGGRRLLHWKLTLPGSTVKQTRVPVLSFIWPAGLPAAT